MEIKLKNKTKLKIDNFIKKLSSNIYIANFATDTINIKTDNKIN